MQIAEIQAKCREVKAYVKHKDVLGAQGAEGELRERFIEHVAEKGGPVLSFKAQMVLSTRQVKFRRK